MNDLIKPETLNIVKCFMETDYLTKVLNGIAAQARSFVPDTSTVKGRHEIASIADACARSKTFLDGAGKELVDAENSNSLKRLKLINNERKRVRDFLDQLKAEVRQPLTLWENAEQERIEAEQATEIERVAALKAESEKKEAERLAAERAEIEAEKVEIARAKVANREAIERAKAEAEKRLEAEQKRIAEEKSACGAHHRCVVTEITQSLVRLGVPEEIAIRVINAGVSGEIPYIMIAF